VNPIEPIGPRPVVRVERVNDRRRERERKPPQPAPAEEQPDEPEDDQTLDVRA
jgi:hypothetical protein